MLLPNLRKLGSPCFARVLSMVSISFLKSGNELELTLRPCFCVLLNFRIIQYSFQGLVFPNSPCPPSHERVRDLQD